MYQPLLPEIVRLHGRWRAAHPAVVTDEETLDWAALDQRSEQVANGLRAAGCGDGARVGIVMNNTISMVEVLIGAMKAGAVAAPLNTSVSDEAINAMLRDAGVGAIFVSREHEARISAEAQASAMLLVRDDDLSRTLWSCYAAWRDAQSLNALDREPNRDDVCNIIYSSGTTGQPKGIAHTFGARLDWTHDLMSALRYHCGARLLIATGLYSNITWAGMLPTILAGGTLILRRDFDASDVLATIERERVTHTSMVPVQFQRLFEHENFDEFDLSSMQAMMCCGAQLPQHIKRGLFEKFSCGVIELYGSTEGIITTLAPEEALQRLASVGKPVPGEDIAIWDDASRPVAAGQSGEIVARSRFAMRGYWNNPTATAEVFATDAAGRTWLRSGDIGHVDEAGYLFITDRKKDMIISGGQNIYPADIEAVLVRHPDILDCAVFGVPSETWGETPLALVVAREGAALDATQVRNWANAQLGKQQRIDAVEVRPSLPRNANGKLLKRDLREPYWAKKAQST